MLNLQGVAMRNIQFGKICWLRLVCFLLIAVPAVAAATQSSAGKAVTAQPIAAKDPFSGTWILNLSKSKMAPPIPRSLTTELVVDAIDIQLTEEIVNSTGESQTIRGKAKFDGKDYPATGITYADTFAFQRVNRNTIKSVAKKAGKIIMRETVVVSPDGKIMTATYFPVDGTSKQDPTVAVFEKKVK